jgi:hypothetical protein
MIKMMGYFEKTAMIKMMGKNVSKMMDKNVSKMMIKNVSKMMMGKITVPSCANRLVHRALIELSHIVACTLSQRLHA